MENFEVNLSEQWRKNAEFVKEIEEESGVNLKACYQCGKCSAGCPAAYRMDITPNRIIRLLQLGLVDEVLKAHAPWICLTCSTCVARCPREIDLPKLMDTIRIIAYKKGITDQAKKEIVFHNAFMKSIKKHGRMFEAGVMADLIFKGNINPMNEMNLVMPMLSKVFLKGKLSLTPHDTKTKNRIKEMAERAERLEAEH